MKKKIQKKNTKNNSKKKISNNILQSIKKTSSKKIKTLVKKRSDSELKKDNLEKKYPMRLSRHLYIENICSRRQADRLIESGEILVDGKKSVLGMRVEKDCKIEFSQNAKKEFSNKTIIIFNKPKGVVSHNPLKEEKEPNDFLPYEKKLSPIGRLDKDSHGLLLMSDNGKIVNDLLNPIFEHNKEYVVEVDKHMNKNFFDKMESGIDIEGYFTKPAKIKKISPRIFSLILHEGKKHQIRRMCAALGYKVLDLKRIKFLNINLGDLPSGAFRKITSQESQKMEKILGKKI